MKVRFNQRETESLDVMISFFLKGNPTTRIAGYLIHEKKFTLPQVDHFLSKLTDLPLSIRNEIYRMAKLMKEHGACDDKSMSEGYNLRRFLESATA